MAEPWDEAPWHAVLFRAAVRVTVPVGAVVSVVAGLLRGVDGLLGALLGTGLVVGSFGLGLWVAGRTARLAPVVTMTAALSSYLFTVTALLLVVVVVRRTGAVDRQAAGVAALVAVLVWLAATLRAFRRLRLYVTPADPVPGQDPPDRG